MLQSAEEIATRYLDEDNLALIEGVFTVQAHESMQASGIEAARLGLPFVSQEALLLGVMHDATVKQLLARQGVTTGNFRMVLMDHINKVYRNMPGWEEVLQDTPIIQDRSGIPLTNDAVRSIKAADDEASNFVNRRTITPVHMLQGLLSTIKGPGLAMLYYFGVDDQILLQSARKISAENRT